MRIMNSMKRIFRYLAHHREELFTSEFWITGNRITRDRFSYFDRVSHAEFVANMRCIEERPWNLHIELTNICNANCIFCGYQFQNRSKKLMTRETYSKALRDYCSIGGGDLRLESCVGDPLVDRQFLERVKEARSHPEIRKIYTLTNGINLDEIGIEKLLRSGIDDIGISTGPWDEDLYRALYRSNEYLRMRNNVTELLKKNEKLGMPVRIKLLVRTNFSMKKTLALSDYQHIRHLSHTVEFNADFDTWVSNITQKDLLIGMRIRPLSKHESEPCYVLYDGPIVFSDGIVGLCSCRDFEARSELIVGNIMENSLLDLWQSKATRDARQRFWNGDAPDICKKCTAYANLDLYRSKNGTLRAKLITEWFNSKTQNVMARKSKSIKEGDIHG